MACRCCSCMAGRAPAPARCIAASSTPAHWRVVIFDQRGAGRSRPLGELRDNTTPHLVDGHRDAARASSASSAGCCSAAPGARPSPWPMRRRIRTACRAACCAASSSAGRSEVDWFLYGLRTRLPRRLARLRRAPAAGRARRPAGRLSSAGSAIPIRRCTCRRRAPGASTKAPARPCCRARRRCRASRRTARRSGLARIEAHYFAHDLFLPRGRAARADRDRIAPHPGGDRAGPLRHGLPDRDRLRTGRGLARGAATRSCRMPGIRRWNPACARRWSAPRTGCGRFKGALFLCKSAVNLQNLIVIAGLGPAIHGAAGLRVRFSCTVHRHGGLPGQARQ